jgi:hypothetical protein
MLFLLPHRLCFQKCNLSRRPHFSRFHQHKICENLRILCSAMWRRVVWYKFNDVSEEYTAHIFKFEDKTKKSASKTLLVFAFFAQSSTLMMEEVSSSDTWMRFNQTTRRHVPEASNLHSYHYENFKSNHMQHFDKEPSQNKLNSSRSKIRMIKWRRIRCEGHVAGMRTKMNKYRILARKGS